MPKYKVEWNEGIHYTAEVIADNPEEALKEAVEHKKVEKRFSNGTTVVNESAGQLLKYQVMWNETYGNATKEEAISLIKTTDKPFIYTHGLAYKKPGTYRVPITREEALKHAMGLADVTEEKDCVHINTFADSDWD